MQVDKGLKARVLRERKRVYVASLYPTVSFVDWAICAIIAIPYNIALNNEKKHEMDRVRYPWWGMLASIFIFELNKEANWNMHTAKKKLIIQQLTLNSKVKNVPDLHFASKWRDHYDYEIAYVEVEFVLEKTRSSFYFSCREQETSFPDPCISRQSGLLGLTHYTRSKLNPFTFFWINVVANMIQI